MRRVTGVHRLAVLGASAVVACAGPVPVDEPPTGSLAVAAETTAEQGSARVSVTTRDGDLDAVVVDGIVDFETGDAELALTTSRGDFRYLSVDGVIYVDVATVTGEEGYHRIDDPGSTLGLSADPAEVLGALTQLGYEPTDGGAGEVRGVPTRILRVDATARDYLAGLDVSVPEGSVLDDLPYVVVVQVDADNLVRRIEQTVPRMARSNGVIDSEAEPVVTVIDFSDFGVAVELVAPPPDQIVELPEAGGQHGYGVMDAPDHPASGLVLLGGSGSSSSGPDEFIFERRVDVRGATVIEVVDAVAGDQLALLQGAGFTVTVVEPVSEDRREYALAGDGWTGTIVIEWAPAGAVVTISGAISRAGSRPNAEPVVFPILPGDGQEFQVDGVLQFDRVFVMLGRAAEVAVASVVRRQTEIAEGDGWSVTERDGTDDSGRVLAVARQGWAGEIRVLWDDSRSAVVMTGDLLQGG